MEQPAPLVPTRSLRDVIAGRINQRWEHWAKTHPHLATAIDQTRLIDATVTRLRHDPQFNDAMRRADLDEAKLLEAVGVLEHAERLIGRLLTL